VARFRFRADAAGAEGNDDEPKRAFAPRRFSVPGHALPARLAARVVTPRGAARALRRRADGYPDPAMICTSHIERQNLTIRMQMRRLTRLTNALSKKWENLWAAYCLHFAYYNFCRIHKTLRVTPAMEAKITNHVWDLAELLA
jgi:hypothetical protein